MSSTDAPRERSLTGRAKPCRIGPIACAPPRCCAELVGDVAGVEVGEHQHVGSAGDRADVLHLLRRDDGIERRVRLQLAVDRELRRASARDGERAHDLVHMRVRRRCPWSRTTGARRAAPRAARAGSSRPRRARCRRAPRASDRHSPRNRRRSARGRRTASGRSSTACRNPGARPTVSIPASITRAVVVAAPATIASASPAFTIRPAWNSGFAARRRAIFGFASGRPSR